MYPAPAVALATADDGFGLLARLSVRASRANLFVASPEVVLLWQRLASGEDLADALRSVARHYQVDEDTVLADMGTTIGLLHVGGFLTWRRWRRSGGRQRPVPAAASERIDAPGDGDAPARYTAAAAVGLTAAVVLLRILPCWLVIAFMRAAKRVRRQAPTLETTLQLVAAAADVATRCPANTDCLEIATAAYLAGVLVGRAPDWRLGASFRPLCLHAWVEVDGTAVDHAPQLPKRAFSVLAGA